MVSSVKIINKINNISENMVSPMARLQMRSNFTVYDTAAPKSWRKPSSSASKEGNLWILGSLQRQHVPHPNR